MFDDRGRRRLRSKSITKHMHVPEGPQRFDVCNGGGRRRRFTAAEKAAIVDESYADGTSVCGIARRHGLTSHQLFVWRRLARVGSSLPVRQQAVAIYKPPSLEN